MAGMGIPMDAGMPMDPGMAPAPMPEPPAGDMVMMLASQLGQVLQGEEAKIAGAEAAALDGLATALESFFMPQPGFAEGMGAPMPAGPPPAVPAPMGPDPMADPMAGALMGMGL